MTVSLAGVCCCISEIRPAGRVSHVINESPRYALSEGERVPLSKEGNHNYYANDFGNVRG